MDPRNILDQIIGFPRLRTTAVAGGTGDATLVSSVIYDREAYSMKPQALAVLGKIAATLAQTKTLVATFQIVSSDASNLASPTVLYTSGAVTLTGPTGGDELFHFICENIDLTKCGRYIGVIYTPELNNTDTDTAYFEWTVVAANFVETPTKATVLAQEKARLEP